MHVLKVLLALVVLLGCGGYWFVSQPQMDPLITEARKKKIEASPPLCEWGICAGTSP